MKLSRKKAVKNQAREADAPGLVSSYRRKVYESKLYRRKVYKQKSMIRKIYQPQNR